MPRQARKESGTGIYHVMLRVINRQDIFEDAEDYMRMLRCLQQMLEQYDDQGNRLPPLCTFYAFWLCAATLDPEVRIVGQENAYKEVIKTAVGGAAGVIHQVESATTDCQPNENVEALRVFMLGKKIEARPTWKPMHKQPVYAGAPVYTNGIEEELFKVGFCLPAGPYVTDEDVRYIVESIREAIVG